MEAIWTNFAPEGIHPNPHRGTPASVPPAPLLTIATTMRVSSHSPDEERDEGHQKKRRRIPPGAKQLLEGRFERHKNNPYIPQSEIEELAGQTGLSVKQIRTFFANARARKLPPLPHSKQGADDPNAGVAGSEDDGPDPMERFLSSSPDDDGVSEDAVRRASLSMSPPDPFAKNPELSKSVETFSIMESAISSASSSSITSIDSVNSRGPRRGRKRPRETNKEAVGTIIRKPPDPDKKYQCTWCTADFVQKYDWRRHEESVHFPQKEWVCLPDGPIRDKPCILCGDVKPDDEHFKTHNCSVCFDAPKSQRAFLRKDKLIQHIGQVHGYPTPKAIKDWCRPIERTVILVCGICGVMVPDWSSRVE